VEFKRARQGEAPKKLKAWVEHWAGTIDTRGIEEAKREYKKAMFDAFGKFEIQRDLLISLRHVSSCEPQTGEHEAEPAVRGAGTAEWRSDPAAALH